MSEPWDQGPLLAVLDRTAKVLDDTVAFLEEDECNPEARDELITRLEAVVQDLADMTSIESDYF
jgi:hypothetical protein